MFLVMFIKCVLTKDKERCSTRSLGAGGKRTPSNSCDDLSLGMTRSRDSPFLGATSMLLDENKKALELCARE